MSNAVLSDMENVMIRVLQDWAMMLVEAGPGGLSAFNADEKFLVATLTFHGVVSGRYCVVCQREFTEALAGNLLGEGDGLSFDEHLDVLKEMVNVISGNLLTSSYGEDSVFELTAPESHQADLAEVCELFKSRTFSYQADDIPVAVMFIPEKVDNDN